MAWLGGWLVALGGMKLLRLSMCSFSGGVVGEPRKGEMSCPRDFSDICLLESGRGERGQ